MAVFIKYMILFLHWAKPVDPINALVEIFCWNKVSATAVMYGSSLDFEYSVNDAEKVIMSE